MDFLPNGYEKPESASKYYKFADGNNYFRILSPAIIGWLDWEDKKPVRTKDKPEQSIDPTKPAKHFWAFAIWDYREKTIKILEITQATIQNAIFDMHNDNNWGSPLNYDINVKKTGKDLETKYSVIPTPPKELEKEIQSAYNSTFIDLNELYRNGDPFKGSIKENQTPVDDYKPEDVDESEIPF